MITVISIVNNSKKAKEYLLKGLAHQTSKHELILINNENSTFKSASVAYNFASQKATGDYIMFVHQDVFLPSNDWLKQTEDMLSSLSRIGLVGVAGMTKPKFLNQFDICLRYYTLKKVNALPLWFLRYGRGNVAHGKDRSSWGGSHIKDVVYVQTVDELLLIVPLKVFEHAKFDELTCDNWHLYGTDYSLSTQAQGYQTCVLPFPVFHASQGKLDSVYFATMSKLLDKYKTESIINTTSGLFPTNRALANLLWSQSKIEIFDVFKDQSSFLA